MAVREGVTNVTNYKQKTWNAQKRVNNPDKNRGSEVEAVSDYLPKYYTYYNAVAPLLVINLAESVFTTGMVTHWAIFK